MSAAEVEAWALGAFGWEQVSVRKPDTSERRPPHCRESVEINNFWDRHGRGLVFHRRWNYGTFCDPRNLAMSTACGHAMPVEVAEKIARPCRKCWTDT